MRALVPVVTSLGLVSLLACAPADTGPDAGGSDFDVFQPGMVKQGDAFRFTLVEAEPSPPDPVEDNHWTVRVSDAADEPLDGLTVWVTPWMPDHAHGTSPPDFDGTPTGTSGEYAIEPFALPMPGVWEFTISAENDAKSDKVVLLLDIEG